ncbi:lipopolysaccharide transport periplasmic protein LptA [Hydrogenophaga aquatica]
MSSNRPLPTRPLLGGVLLAVAAIAWLPAHAERADRLQPMNVEADALRYDDARQTSVFTGNVVITKGTIVIRGHQVDVRQDPQGNQFGTVTGGKDKLAFFRQKREGLQEFIEGEAQRIDYDSQADTVKFTGQAVLRRFKGATLNDQTSGGVIIYDNKSETFSVDGGSPNRTPENPSGRVRAVLTPNSATAAPPAAPAPNTRPLQPSPRMETRP